MAENTIKFLSNINIKDILWAGNGPSPIATDKTETQTNGAKVVIKGDLIAIGRNIVSILEEVTTDENTIILRSNAEGILSGPDVPGGFGEFCGFIANKCSSFVQSNPDTSTTIYQDGLLIFDGQGTAFVGSRYWDEEKSDYEYDVQPLAVRNFLIEDNYKIALWDSDNLCLKASNMLQDSIGNIRLTTGAFISGRDPQQSDDGKVLITRNFLVTTINNILQFEPSHSGTIPMLSHNNSTGRCFIPSDLKFVGNNIELKDGLFVAGRAFTEDDTNELLVTTKEYVDKKINTSIENSHDFSTAETGTIGYWDKNTKTIKASSILLNNNILYGYTDNLSEGTLATAFAPKGYVDTAITNKLSNLAAEVTEKIINEEKEPEEFDDNGNPIKKYLPTLVNAVMEAMDLWEPNPGGY